MSSVYTKILFVCLILQLTNIIANADSPKIRWSNTNKTIAPEMIQVSDDGNYLHTLQNIYYKKIDLNTDSIVKVLDLNQVCIKALRTLIDYDGKLLKIDPVFYFNYPNITLLFRASDFQYALYFNIESENFRIIPFNHDVINISSNDNYTIFHNFYIQGSPKGSLRISNIQIWDYHKNKVRQIFKSISNDSVAVSAGLYDNNKYWTLRNDNNLRLYNSDNDSLVGIASVNFDTYLIANYKLVGDDLYFLNYEYFPTGENVNLRTMAHNSKEKLTFPSYSYYPNDKMMISNLIGYSSRTYKSLLLIFDVKENIIKYQFNNTDYFRTFDIDTIQGYLYYIAENNPSKINRLNLKDSTVDRVLSFDLPKSNFKIGKEIITNYISRAARDNRLFFLKYTLFNIEKGGELSNYKIDSLNILSNLGHFFYDSSSNNFYPIYFDGSSFITFDYQTKQIINSSIKDTIIPYYHKPFGIYTTATDINTIDILNNSIIEKISATNYRLLDISRDGRIIRLKGDNKYFVFYDMNEKKLCNYPWNNNSNANHINLIGNSGNFITQNGKQVILRHFKNLQDTVILGTSNSIITTSTFTTNERMIITGDITGKITFWNVLTKSKNHEIDLNMDIKKIDLTLDEKGLLVLSGDGSLTMLDVDDILLTDVKENVNRESELIIYPNPATDYFTINLNRWSPPSRWTPSAIEIYDVMGMKIQTTPINLITALSEGEGARIDVSNLAPGVYFVKVFGSNGACSIVEKFVKM